MIKKKDIYQLSRAGFVCEEERKKEVKFAPLPPEIEAVINKKIK